MKNMYGVIYGSLAEAAEELQKQIALNEYDNPRFYVAANLLFGDKLLSEWCNTEDPIACIKKALNDNMQIFRDADKKTDIVGYASGTKYASAGFHRFDERGSEYIFSDQGGDKYRLFSSGEKVLNAPAASWLYDFANSRGRGVLDNIVASLSGVARDVIGKTFGTEQHNEIHMGDINIHGNADEKTVSDIRKAQRETVSLVLKELNKLKK